MIIGPELIYMISLLSPLCVLPSSGNQGVTRFHNNGLENPQNKSPVEGWVGGLITDIEHSSLTRASHRLVALTLVNQKDGLLWQLTTEGEYEKERKKAI